MNPPVFSAALRLLTVAPRTRAELVDRLVQKGHGRADAEQAASEAVARGLIDERAIAGAAVRAGLRAGRALAEIERALAARGVEDPTIRAALADEQAGTDDARALEAALGLARRGAGLPPAKRMQRVLLGLVRKGYDEETSMSAARRALEKDPLPDPSGE